jgi:hypothetical protein
MIELDENDLVSPANVLYFREEVSQHDAGDGA